MNVHAEVGTVLARGPRRPWEALGGVASFKDQGSIVKSAGAYIARPPITNPVNQPCKPEGFTLCSKLTLKNNQRLKI